MCNIDIHIKSVEVIFVQCDKTTKQQNPISSIFEFFIICLLVTHHVKSTKSYTLSYNLVLVEINSVNQK